MKIITPKSVAAWLAAGCLLLAGCSPSTSPEGGETSAAGDSGPFPVSVMSCDEEITFEQAPEKVLVLDDTDLSVLAGLDLLDKVVARSGKLRTAPYDEDVLAKIKEIPEIESTVLDSGGTQVSTETIIESGAELVIGFDAGVDREALGKAGIPLYAPVSFCANLDPDRATWDMVTDEITKIAKIFGVTEKGDELVAEMNSKIENIKPEETLGTAAALYVMPGSEAFYVYGNSSMVQPILEANGLENVYGDDATRVFDGSMEDLLAKDPDYLVLLYGEGDEDDAEPTLMSYAGAEKLSAVINKKVVIMAFSLTDPPTPNSVKGATVLNDRINELD